MIKELSFTAIFNKEIPNSIPTTPGGFSFVRDVEGNSEVTFDFEDSETIVDGDKRHFTMRNLDTESFPESKHITPGMFDSIVEFSDIFVDLDDADDDVKVVAIEGMEVIFDGDIVVNVSRDLLDKYNNKYLS